MWHHPTFQTVNLKELVHHGGKNQRYVEVDPSPRPSVQDHIFVEDHRAWEFVTPTQFTAEFWK